MVPPLPSDLQLRKARAKVQERQRAPQQLRALNKNLRAEKRTRQLPLRRT
jgi:hypothetical protein